MERQADGHEEDKDASRYYGKRAKKERV